MKGLISKAYGNKQKSQLEIGYFLYNNLQLGGCQSLFSGDNSGFDLSNY